MKKRFYHKALLFARKGGIYSNVKPVGIWNGYAVFEPRFATNELVYTGLPRYILVKDGNIRWDNGVEECFEILDYFAS